MKRVVMACRWCAVLLLAGAVSVAAAEKKIKVVATTSMVADLVKKVGGDLVEVQGLMGPGVDPHLYKATATDVARLQRAQLIIYNGLMLEGQMGDLLGRLANSRRVVAVGESL